jgi:hypothetical protein
MRVPLASNRCVRAGWRNAAGFGVAVYALAFFDPLGLVMGLLFAALAVHVLRDQEHPGDVSER